MIVIAKLKAQVGKEPEMEKALREMILKVEKEEGTLTYTLHLSQNDPTLFLLYEKYQDKAAFEAHSSTPYFKELFATIGPLFAAEPVIEMPSTL
ncbi:MAG: putative quinol monooxygenase [Chloroflexota bacterium]|nr:putative quinol monooxygenase [Chloroflexota bacterium]